MNEEYLIPIVDARGRVAGYADRWLTHTVFEEGGKLVLGQKHVGICVACQDPLGRILVQRRRHVIFDGYWSLTADTHPRKYEGLQVESLATASTRCAREDLGINVTKWVDALVVSYSARDPRNPKYCENELMHLMVGKYNGTVRANKKNVYGFEWKEPRELRKEAIQDESKDPKDRKYAPWIRPVFEELERRKKDWASLASSQTRLNRLWRKSGVA